MDCHAVFVKTARNDGGFCHFERSALAQSEKSTEFKTRLKFKAKNPYFDLWILRFAQYDKDFVILTKKGGFIKPALKGINSHAPKARTQIQAQKETRIHKVRKFKPLKRDSNLQSASKRT